MSLGGGNCGACEGFGVVWERGREWICRVCKGTGDKPPREAPEKPGTQNEIRKDG